MNSFDTIIKKYREHSFSQRQKGEKFERLIWAYFLTEKIYRNTYQQVWMWDDFPYKGDFGGADFGIDLVGLTNIGKFHAIQCKFYAEGSQVDKKGVDSFLATSQKTFAGYKRFASRYFVSTTNNWSRPAELAIQNQNPPVQRIRLSDLRNANVDWVKLNGAITGEDAIKAPPKELRDYQQDALEEALSHYDKHRRGKLIMACGTGKTLTSLRISEAITDSEGMVLFMMPSLALLGQTIRAWNDDAKKKMYTIVVCSDPKTNRFKPYEEDSLLASLVDIGLPASTDPQEIFHQIKGYREKQNREGGLIVIFSTYHSIGVSARAQEMLSIEGIDAEFDLIICDEAHQTTGIRRSGEDNTAFTLVHDNDKIRGKKRMYMTATPRMYSDQAKTQASDSDADVYSMDDEGKYGKEFYRLGFARAVKLRQLSPYQVLALGYRPEDIPQDLQEYIKKKEGVLEGKTREVTDLMSSLGATIGCINAMAKRGLNDQVIFRFASLNNLSPEELKDPQPMKTAVAFCKTVAHSKTVRNLFNSLSDALRDAEEFSTINGNKKRVYVQAEHVDGYMDVPKRDALLDWLKSPQAETEHPTCKVLSNVRCLSEGVDVPSLDAALFISPKDSQIEVVQAVGRVMRKATGKKFGYIIIPVLMEEGANYRDILDKKKNFRTVWTVLKALKAHDEDFNVIIEKMKINTPTHTEHSGPGGGQEIEITEKLRRDIIAMSSKVKAVLVDGLTDRSYWTSWAKEAGMMARKQEEDIRRIIEEDTDNQKMFEEFLDGLKESVSPNITEKQAREMLGQHMVTKPIFESLFEGYSFANKNAVSQTMEFVVEYLQENLTQKVDDNPKLKRFYRSVKDRVSGIDNPSAKQDLIRDIYDNFFREAFPKVVEQLGIVYTPVEVVDFIIHSVNDLLKKEFRRSISDKGVRILDPFTGTGTFITRLFQSGLIEQEDLHRKYAQELVAFEIVLMAYYVASVNIENAYHDATEDPDDGIGTSDFTSFEGIVLTDTFQSTEKDKTLMSKIFPENSKRLKRQKKLPITVIMGNPPYSMGQKSANDNAQNENHPDLKKRIKEKYVSKSSSVNNSLYDSYIKAYRWSSDRIDEKEGGVIAFVTNGGWLESASGSGFRKCIEEEFSSIYVFNLRGNQRTSGELSRKEGGKIFGSGSRAPIAITLLVKQPNHIGKANIYYHDIGDYLDRKQKLMIISDFKSMEKVPLKKITTDNYGDWINQRKEFPSNFIPIEPTKKFQETSESFYTTYSCGVKTNRDFWVYNFSTNKLNTNVNKAIDFYNEQVNRYSERENKSVLVEDFIDLDPKRFSWSGDVIKNFKKGKKFDFDQRYVITSQYRPFCKQQLYFNRYLNNSHFQNNRLFPLKTSSKVTNCSPPPNI